MGLTFSNLEIGINENGCHFQDPETGFIFSLLCSSDARVDIAICKETINEKQDYTEIIRNLISAIGFTPPKEFVDIPKEKTYISGCKKFMFDSDNIMIKHIESKKVLGLKDIDENKLIFLFFSDNYYGYEKCIRDLFELCAPNITKLQVGPYFFNIPIRKEYSEHKIKIFVLNAFAKYIEERLERWAAEATYEENEYSIIIKNFLFLEGEIIKKSGGRALFYCRNRQLLEVKKLAYLFDAIERFQISSIKCKYLKDDRWQEIIIPRNPNVHCIVKKAVYNEIFDLTI